MHCLVLLEASARRRSCSQVVSKLHQILKPFLLRRVKTDVETSLPGKMEVRGCCCRRALMQWIGHIALQPHTTLPPQSMCFLQQGCLCRPSILPQVILYASMTDKQRELNQQLRDKTLNVRHPAACTCDCPPLSMPLRAA